MSVAGLLGLGFGTAAAGSAPAAPTLSVVDVGNGTATATIAGSSALSANVVWTLKVDNDFISGSTWTNSGNRTADGDVTLTLADGLYWVHVISTLNSQCASSNWAYLRVSSGVESVFLQCASAVQSRIRSLSLADITSGEIIIRKREWLKGTPKPPKIIIVPQTEAMPPRAGTNDKDDVTYPITIVMLRAGNQNIELADGMSEQLLWREKIARAFRNQRLPGATTVQICHVTPGGIWPDAALKAMYDGQSLTVNCISREIRGV